MTEDEILHQKGQEAESFIKSLEEGDKYFLGVLETIQKEIFDSILNLRPHQKDEFAFYKTQLETLYAPLRKIQGDVIVGKQAWDRINGVVNEKEGIL